MADERTVKIPEHTILSRLGRGGMASVYLARHDRLGRLVAVKVIDDRFDDDSHFRQRFEREARTAAGLTHPNIVPVHEYGFTDDGRPFLTMAFLEGGSLRERLQKRGPMPVDEALAITRQVAAALLVAHSRNIVHRDLKPDNVLFQGDTALLTDFGIAKVLDASTALTGMGSNPGTVKYFSPEQAKEQNIDQRSDIYTLGVVLYEMLTGHIPIEGETVMQLILGIAQKAPDPLPPPLKGLQPFLDVMLAKDPNDRVASCADVISIIQAMERNWLRFGEVDRLTDGVAMTTSTGAAPTPVVAQAGVATAASLAPPHVAHVAHAAHAAHAAMTPRGSVDTDAATLLVASTAAASPSADAPLHDGLTLPITPARSIEDEPLNDGQTIPMQRPAAAPAAPPLPPIAPTAAVQAADMQALRAESSPGRGDATPARVPRQAGGNNKFVLGGIAALVVVAAGIGFTVLKPSAETPSPPTTIAAAPELTSTDTRAVAVPSAPAALPEKPVAAVAVPTAPTSNAVAAAPATANATEAKPATPEPKPSAKPAAKPEKPAVAVTPPKPVEEPESAAPPRDFLVGKWEFEGTEFGERVHLLFTVADDGRTRYVFNPGTKMVNAANGKWTYSDGVLSESFGESGGGRAKVRRISNNEFEVRIIDNGDPKYRNLKRRYRRVD